MAGGHVNRTNRPNTWLHRPWLLARRPTPRGTMRGVQVAVRLSREEIGKLDAWIAEQREKLGVELSRAAAIRAVLIR